MYRLMIWIPWRYRVPDGDHTINVVTETVKAEDEDTTDDTDSDTTDESSTETSDESSTDTDSSDEVLLMMRKRLLQQLTS